MKRIIKKKLTIVINKTGRILIQNSVKLKNQKFYKILP